jgi:hypothetical protein
VGNVAPTVGAELLDEGTEHRVFLRSKLMPRRRARSPRAGTSSRVPHHNF